MPQKYPISMDVKAYCPRCIEVTDHAVRIYQDVEYYHCLLCGYEHPPRRFDREVGRELIEMDQKRVNAISNELNNLCGEAINHDPGKIGKKHRAWLSNFVNKLLRVQRDVNDLKNPPKE
jgi:Zn ribbon nucleic-acid-binding protein